MDWREMEKPEFHCLEAGSELPSAFISPFRAERSMARELLADGGLGGPLTRVGAGVRRRADSVPTGIPIRSWH
jgi:hypothetical protein